MIKALHFLPVLCKCEALICLFGLCLRNLLYELSEGISSENLKSMIFLLREPIPKVQMTSRSFLEYLEKQAKIDEDNVTLLENLCQKIVPNLMEKLHKYKRER